MQQSILLNTSTVRSRHPSQTSSESSTSDSNTPSKTIRFAPLPNPRKDEESAVFYPEDSDSDTPSPSSATIECPPSPRFSFKATFPKSKSGTWTNLLRPLFKSNTGVSVEDGNDSVYKGGVPLSRRRSTGCNLVASAKEVDRTAVYRDGAPLTHVNSDSAARRTVNNPGQRMLNGRVYGRRSNSTSLRTESHEPEFVEWGYGGMGSVANSVTKGQRAHGVDWAKVQSSEKFNGHDADDADDGSGMQWVKRRREQREREKRERERHESSKQAIPEIAIHPPTHDTSQPPDGSVHTDRDEHHIYQAINIPATTAHHHHHHHSPYRHHKSAHNSVSPDSSAPDVTLRKENPSSGSSRTSSNGHSSGADCEEDNDTERDSSDNDDDEDEIEEARITSKCAGVEKISRHKD
ncbi:hypothetical protein Clacol_006467 [Clathrus columnatus]|uniref:Uncharacterized protein n=1 Tax=Clathrus columnatus TaxID=1419009 RepID=A0AAV5AC52_9AGAM|nr:hypothetical protein Clacol_006467 [Clathrus columnatus]